MFQVAAFVVVNHAAEGFLGLEVVFLGHIHIRQRYKRLGDPVVIFREVVGHIEDLVFSFVILFQLNGGHGRVIGTLGSIHRLVVARALVEFLDGSIIVTLLEVRLAHDMIDLVDLFFGQVARLTQALAHLNGFVVFAHEEVALHAAFKGFETFERLLGDTRQAFIVFARLIVIALFVLDARHFQQRIVGVVVVGLRQYIIKVCDDLILRPYPFSTFEAIIMRFQQIRAVAEVVEIILQGGLCLLITTVKVEALRIGKGQGVLLSDFHLTSISIDISEVLIQLVLFHIDAADDAQGFTRFIRVGIGGHQILQVGQGLVVLVVVVVNHSDLHHRLTGIARTRPVLDQTVEISDGRALVTMHEISVADFEQRLLIIWCAGISLHQVVQHGNLLIYIAFCTIAKCLLVKRIVGITFPDAGGQVVIIDGIGIATLHEVAVTETDVSIGLEVVVGGRADETSETANGGYIFRLLIVDVTHVVVSERVFRQAGCPFH